MLQTQAEKYNREQVRWACRRGMLELDQILIPFFDAQFDNLSADKQQIFVNLLAATDQELHSWLLGVELPAQPHWQDLVMVMRYLAKKNIKVC